MNKTQRWDAVEKLLNDNGFAADSELYGSMAELLKPKAGGGGGGDFDPKEVANFDEDGHITHILCSTSKLWFSVQDEEGNDLFYARKQGSNSLNGYTRTSKPAHRLNGRHKKMMDASEKAIFADLLAGEIDNDTAQAKMEELKDSKPDYSVLGGFTERPEIDEPVYPVQEDDSDE